MRKSVSVILLAGAISFGAAGQETHSVGTAEKFDNQKVVRISPRSIADVNLLEQISGDRWTCGAGGPNGEADYRVRISDLPLLNQAGVPYRVIIDDVQSLIDGEQAELFNPFQDRGFFDAYQDYAAVSAYVDNLVATYPGWVTRISLGNSIQGRPIFGFRATSPVPPIGGSPRKPVVFFNSLQHAREWIGVMSNLYVATQLLSTYSTNAAAREMLDTYEFVFVPISNPDGYNLTWTGQRLWRKNARVISGTVRGVDLNRNWSVGWGLSSGSSGSSTSETYRGSAPFSEPETQVLRDYAISVPKLVASIDFHSYSQLVLRPWTYQYTLPPGKVAFDRIGSAMVNAIASSTGTQYTYGGPDILYLASGTAPDWFFGTTGSVALTIELRDTGQYGFVLPASYIVPTGQDAWAAATTMITSLCRADLNRDNFVDDSDFVLFAAAYDAFLTNAADFTGDAITDDYDFVIFADAYDHFTCP
ncbi:MAG: hypothetical protein KF805_01325 [Phycisphaeraceae bacterium]|nr:hypothetical protein [Phycisphaeraceae bacterium]